MVMGFGRAGSGGCCTSIGVSDSGNGATPQTAIATAAVRPVRGGANMPYRICATWASAGGAPQALYAVVDGNCTPMAMEMGNPSLNSTWTADVMPASGCHTYW